MILALILAAISVTPAYTNVNRAGGSKIMTNIEQWAPAIEAAIGQGGGGGVSTNAVSGIITNHVTSGYLATVSALSSLASIQSLTSATQATLNAAKADAAAKYLPAIYDDITSVFWEGGYFVVAGNGPIARRFNFIEPGRDNTGIIKDDGAFLFYNSWNVSQMSGLTPDGSSVLTQNKADVRYAPTSTAVTVASHASQLSQLSQSIDYTTNNTQLVSTITNLAPSKARGISLSDPVRHCNWYQAVTNGVFYWMVEE